MASWLCPAHLRPAVIAIYWFARTADDIADEGHASASQRLDDLAAYRADLWACVRMQAVSTRWPRVFGPLASAVRQFALPPSLLDDLLSAFEQDVRKTRDAQGYADRAELLDYCRRSANPVGRLLLHLYGVSDADSLLRSDRICTALQLINFWQDLSVDLPRGRHYVSAQDAQAYPRRDQLVAALVAWTRGLMHEGAPLVHRVPGRAGWELRLVVQGGVRILDKTATLGARAFECRPRLRAWDGPALLWRALTMRPRG